MKRKKDTVKVISSNVWISHDDVCPDSLFMSRHQPIACKTFEGDLIFEADELRDDKLNYINNAVMEMLGVSLKDIPQKCCAYLEIDIKRTVYSHENEILTFKQIEEFANK